MYEVEVEIVNPPILQLLLADRPDPLAVVERVPELTDQEEVLALDEAILDCSGYTLASLLLVAVVCETISSCPSAENVQPTARAVKQPVAGFDCIVHRIGAGLLIHLPQPKTDLWHVMAAVQLDRGLGHFCRMYDRELQHEQAYRSRNVWEKSLKERGVGFSGWRDVFVSYFSLAMGVAG